MEAMISLVRLGSDVDPLTRCLMLMGKAYGVPICTYALSDIDMETGTANAVFWREGTTVKKTVPCGGLVDLQYSRILLPPDGDLREKNEWLVARSTIVDNSGIPKKQLSQILMSSPLAAYAIPTYAVSTPEQVEALCAVIPNAIIKPSGGRKGKGVNYILQEGGRFFLKNKDSCTPLNSETWKEYLQYLNENSLGSPILQPRLSFCLDEKHALDFRLLVARGFTGNWETIDIYPRIGASPFVSNVAQGGYIGDTWEVLQSIAGDAAEQLLSELNMIARELPVLIQENCPAPITSFGIDVGIDLSSMRPFILEANTRPSTKLHTWRLAEKKVHYYKHLLSQE